MHAMLNEGLSAKEAFVGNRHGDVDAALQKAAQVVEAEYYYPWQHHATMEPMNGIALVTDDRAEAWLSTQDAERDLELLSTITGLDISQCDVHRFHLGGGFGRRGAVHDFAEIAVKVAVEMKGTPVKVIWSREEDMTHGAYHPVTKCRMRGALDENGNLIGLHMRISGQSIAAGLFPSALREGMDPFVFQGLHAADDEDGQLGYTVENLLIDHAMRNPPLRPCFWRGVNNNQNAFYLESFIDELAEAAGKDPLEFRRGLMQNHPKHLAVLNAVADAIGWEAGPPEGHAYGICQHMGYGSYVAAAADISIENGTLKIHRMVAATDPGHVVNPQQVEAQIEGSFSFGLSASLFGEITVENGRVQQQNFDTYPVLQMWDMPAVDKLLLPTGGFWGGVGEPTIFVATPAVMNAVYVATGRRIRDLPLRKHDLV
jgi:isoquinoline 1-oxidoreductase beta subunit